MIDKLRFLYAKAQRRYGEPALLRELDRVNVECELAATAAYTSCRVWTPNITVHALVEHLRLDELMATMVKSEGDETLLEIWGWA